MMMLRFLIVWSFLAILPFSALADRPNVVVIMADDLGYSDLGCYGSEIETPNLDLLAKNGLRFSQFYNTAKCHSSRVSLLTGQYCVPAGDTALTHAVTSAEVLRSGGYFTAMTGKWHLDKNPLDFGFGRYFGHLSGACNYFTGDKTFRLDREPWKIPNDGFYTTVANVDFALDFVKEARQSNKPWYLYMAFNAPHAPLHALPQDYDKYQGRYDAGWDVVRAARVANQKTIGLLPNTLQASDRPEHIPAWQELEPWRQKYEINRMRTLAAMIDRLDQEIGRLIQNLRASGELKNTLIWFVSDNGACPYDRSKPLLDVAPTNASVTLADSTGWAWARNSPFRYYKQNQFEGGISTPAILHWPAGLKTKPGSITSEPAHLIDVLPTLADIAECKIPNTHAERELRSVSGISIRSILENKPNAKRPPIHLQYQMDRGLRDGDWKLVSFQGQEWELYNLAVDRTETNDLAAREPRRLAEMVQMWNEMAENELHLPAKFTRDATKSDSPHKHREWTDFTSTEPNPSATGRADRRKEQSPRGEVEPRARKNTRLTMADGMWQLEFTGDDPGILIDWRGHEIASGPYELSFRMRGGDKNGGELYYTVDEQMIPQRGVRLPIQRQENPDSWQELKFKLPIEGRIFQLRIDPAQGPGKATITNLTLRDKNGKTIVAW